MNDEKLKYQLGANIVLYRKRIGLTQAGLAEKLSYSDKAVSKWERGESVPDVLTLVQLAELFGVTVNDLLLDPDALPEHTSKVEKVMEKAVEKTLKRKADKGIILGLSTVLVWFVALLIFVVLSTIGLPKSWIAFFYAIPANAIVLLTLRSAWHDFRWNRLLVSAIMWGSLLSIHVTLLVFFNFNAWKIFLLGIPGQIAVFLWFRMFRPADKEIDNG
ncbi:MAG: helix-turn-helix transcriptional regulator [Oscillospiraceae bacterium]|nr:helix-turn-helix transcriptional regulator [Oscillospiraceae bacterium]